MVELCFGSKIVDDDVGIWCYLDVVCIGCEKVVEVGDYVGV